MKRLLIGLMLTMGLSAYADCPSIIPPSPGVCHTEALRCNCRGNYCYWEWVCVNP